MKFKEIKTGCRTFQLGDEPELIHIHRIREDEYMVVHEDAYDLHTGKVDFMNIVDLEKRYGRILTPFKKGDKVALTDECKGAYGLDSSESDFYVIDILAKDYPYNIVVGNTKFGTDWNEFFMEDEVILIEE